MRWPGRFAVRPDRPEDRPTRGRTTIALTRAQADSDVDAYDILPASIRMNGSSPPPPPPSLEPESIVLAATRPVRLVDRYEMSLALLVALWTASFVLRERLAQADRLSAIVNEALLSLLLVVPIMLAAWGVLAFADRRLKLGWFDSRDPR